MCRKLSSRTMTFLGLFVLSFLLTAPAVAHDGYGSSREPVTAEQEKDFAALMTKGKLATDLGNYENASDAFASIAHDETAPTALRWEALVRYGLVLSAAGETTKSREAFKTVLAKYSEEPEAVRFLTYAVTGGLAGKVWLDFKAEFEDLLRTAEVASTEDIGNVEYGVKIVNLERGEIELKSIWKPIVSQTPPRESYLAEIAAYELDKILELDMVPPAVERNIEGRPGAIQLWVHGCKVYRDVEGQTPTSPEWNRELSRMKTFDNLIGNRDRHTVQILIDPNWEAVLIDHSRAFSSVEDIEDPPMQFDRQLIEKLRALSEVGLQARLEGILVKKDIENILKRRDLILAFVEQLVAEKGEAAVFF